MLLKDLESSHALMKSAPFAIPSTYEQFHGVNAENYKELFDPEYFSNRTIQYFKAARHANSTFSISSILDSGRVKYITADGHKHDYHSVRPILDEVCSGVSPNDRLCYKYTAPVSRLHVCAAMSLSPVLCNAVPFCKWNPTHTLPFWETCKLASGMDTNGVATDLELYSAMQIQRIALTSQLVADSMYATLEVFSKRKFDYYTTNAVICSMMKYSKVLDPSQVCLGDCFPKAPASSTKIVSCYPKAGMETGTLRMEIFQEYHRMILASYWATGLKPGTSCLSLKTQYKSQRCCQQ